MPTHTFIIGRRQAGQPLVDFLRGQLRLPRSDLVDVVRLGGVRLAGNACIDPNRRVRSGQRIHVTIKPRRSEPPKGPGESQACNLAPHAARLAGIVIRYADEAIAVVEKPAGLTTVRHADEAAEFGQRAGRYLPRTLTSSSWTSRPD